jgi:hypothetical protein
LRVVILCDTHVGATSALWPKGGRVEGGGEYEQNAAQRFLWKCWSTALGEIAAFKPNVIVMNGDAIQGASHKDGAVVSNNVAIQSSAAHKLLSPLLELCTRFYMVRGTEFHDGRSAQEAEVLAARLGAEPDSVTGQSSHWQLWLSMDGILVHVKHAIGVTGLPTSEGTAPLRDLLQLRSELSRHLQNKALDLRCIVRSHRHRSIHETVPPDLHAVTVCGWQLGNPYSIAKIGTLPEVGYATLESKGGELFVRLRAFPLPPPKIIVV